MDLTCDEEMLSESESGTPAAQKGHHVLTTGEGGGGLLDSMQFYDDMPPAYVDPSLVQDDRVLENMLKVEERLMPSVGALKLIQTEITPDMRQLVATWMYEVGGSFVRSFVGVKRNFYRKRREW